MIVACGEEQAEEILYNNPHYVLGFVYDLIFHPAIVAAATAVLKELAALDPWVEAERTLAGGKGIDIAFTCMDGEMPHRWPTCLRICAVTAR